MIPRIAPIFKSLELLAIAMTFCAGLATGSSRADAAEPAAGGFWGGVEIGAGSMRRTTTETHTDSTLYLVLKGGYAVSERLLFGAELGGHTLEAGNLWDPAKGAGVSQLLLVAQYYLQPVRSGWYVKGGAGYVSYWDNAPGGLADDGWGTTAALGHDWRTEGFGTLGPLISFGYGKGSNLDHRSIAVALSWFFP